MSLIQDFDKLHITTKSASLTILAQMPFFFVSIYLFNHSLMDLISENPYLDVDFLFTISLCFCLSFTWFAMNLLLTFIVFKFGDFLYEDETDISDVFKMSTIYSLGYLSIAIFINFKVNFSFFNFILIAYGFVIFRMLLIGIAWVWVFIKNNKNKRQETDKNQAEELTTEVEP